MDLPQIGAHCSLPSCNLLDFLPIVCRCGQSFCSQHVSSDCHDCPAVIRPTELAKSPDPLLRCCLEGCSKPSLRNYSNPLNEICPTCQRSFCAEHRHPETHKCPAATVPSSNPTSAFKPDHFAAKLRAPLKKAPADPTKFAQWQRMELMKMRHRAVPGDPKDKTVSLPPTERIHVKIQTDKDERIFWFRKTIVTGRALDLLVAQLKLSFPANQPLKLVLLQLSDKERNPVLLQNDKLLAEQVGDGSQLSIFPATY